MEKEIKMHLRDPKVPRTPLCCVNPGLALTDNPHEVTCGNCLRMMERERRVNERRELEKGEL